MFTVVLLHLTAYFVACDCTHCRLLDILAGRKDRRRVTGEIRLNGEVSPKDMQHQLGYVVQVRYCCMCTTLVCMVHPSTERHPQGKPNRHAHTYIQIIDTPSLTYSVLCDIVCYEQNTGC